MRLEPWDDRALEFERRANVLEMKAHLGGVETGQAVLDRHERVRAIVRDDRGSMFLVMLAGVPGPVGSIGYWERDWRGETVYETGWKVLPAFQGRGRWMHAFPQVGNGPSNAVCRRAGFILLGETDFEFPKGNPIVSNDWRCDLRSDPAWAGP